MAQTKNLGRGQPGSQAGQVLFFFLSCHGVLIRGFEASDHKKPRDPESGPHGSPFTSAVDRRVPDSLIPATCEIIAVRTSPPDRFRRPPLTLRPSEAPELCWHHHRGDRDAPILPRKRQRPAHRNAPPHAGEICGRPGPNAARASGCSGRHASFFFFFFFSS